MRESLPSSGHQQQVLLILASIRGHGNFGLEGRLAEVHRQGMLTECRQALVRAARSHLRLVRGEGDQVIWTASGDDTALHACLLDMMSAFDEVIRHLVATNTCACQACQGASKLRLKLLAHAGDVSVIHDDVGPVVGGEALAQALRLADSCVQESSCLLITDVAAPYVNREGSDSAGFEEVTLHPAGIGEAPALLRILDREWHVEQGSAPWSARLGMFLRKTFWDLTYRR